MCGIAGFVYLYARPPTAVCMVARGLVDVAGVRRRWRRALSAPSTTEAFWIPVALELWAEQFIDGRGYPR